VQHDFMSGGALVLPHRDEIVPLFNRLGARFANVVLGLSRRSVYLTANRSSGRRTACRAGTALRCTPTSTSRMHSSSYAKGHHREIDSYSAFVEADRKTSTGLAGYLRDAASPISMSVASPSISASPGPR